MAKISQFTVFKISYTSKDRVSVCKSSQRTMFMFCLKYIVDLSTHDASHVYLSDISSLCNGG